MKKKLNEMTHCGMGFRDIPTVDLVFESSKSRLCIPSLSLLVPLSATHWHRMHLENPPMLIITSLALGSFTVDIFGRFSANFQSHFRFILVTFAEELTKCE